MIKKLPNYLIYIKNFVAASQIINTTYTHENNYKTQKGQRFFVTHKKHTAK